MTTLNLLSGWTIRQAAFVYRFCVAALICALSGCASAPVAPSNNFSDAVRGRSVVIVQHHNAKLRITTALGVAAVGLTGIVGAFVEDEASKSHGERERSKDQIHDPSIDLSERVADFLQKRFGAASISQGPQLDDVDLDNSKDVIDHLPNDGILLEVHTTHWEIIYFATNWVRYQVWYSAVVSIYDADKHTVLTKYTCNIYDKSTDNAPTLAEMTANNGELIRKKDSVAVDTCFNQFISQFGQPL